MNQLETVATEAQHQNLDALEMEMLDRLAPVELSVVHRFTPGLYGRELRVPARTLVVTKIHATDHQFVLLEGRISVWSPDGSRVDLEAPLAGVTKAGTRRVIFNHSPVRFITYHALEAGEESEADLEAIEARVIERRELPGGKTTYELYQEALARGLPEGGTA